MLTIVFSQQIYSQIPTITSFSPTSGKVGDVVTISGNNFSPTLSGNKVFFGYTQAIVSSATTTSLTVKVPIGATYEPIKVLNTTSSLIGVSSRPFNPTFPCSGGLSSSSFADQIEFDGGTGFGSSFLAIDDLDGDGLIDIIGSQGSGFVATFKNKSESSLYSFYPKENFSISSGYYFLADLDGDGRKDVLSAQSFGGIKIIRNLSVPGDIAFSAPEVSVSGSPGKISIGDLDGDGKPDLVIAYSTSNKISIMRNTSTVGSFSFAAIVNYTTGFNPNTSCIADLDGDGKLDIAVTNQNDNNVSVFRNMSTLGNISFDSRVNFTTGVTPQAILATDLNGDGKPDLVVANYASNSVSIFENSSILGTVSFAGKVDLSTSVSPSQICFNDIDGDGKPDIIVDNRSPLKIDVFINSSVGNILSFNTILGVINTSYTSSSISSLNTGDIDGDTKPDIVVISSANKVGIYRNQINGPTITSFAPVSVVPGATVTITGSNFTGATSVLFGDIPASSFTVVSPTSIEAQVGLGKTGYVEVITPCGNVKKSLLTVLSNVPKITSFTPEYGSVGSTVTISGVNFNPVASANMVSFGSIPTTVVSGTTTELVVKVPAGSNYQPISVLETGSGLIALSERQFTTTPTCVNALDANSFISSKLKIKNQLTSSITGIKDSEAADFDGDGKPDLVVLGSTTQRNITVYRNVSNVGQFLFDSSTVCNTVYGATPKGIYSGDIDGDGKTDLILLNNTANITIYKNTSVMGVISFSLGVSFATLTNPMHAAIGDLNKDGKLDIVVTNNNGSFSILRNIGNHTIDFATKVDYTGLPATAYCAIGDIDGDQMPEIVLASSNGAPTYLSILPNTSIAGGSIIAFGTAKNFTSFGLARDVSIGDVDGDGKLDVLLALNSYITVYRNTTVSGAISFDSGLNLATNYSETKSYRLALSDFDGDGKPEIATSYNMSLLVFKNKSTPGTLSFDNVLEYGNHNTTLNYMVIRDFDGDGGHDVISTFFTDATQITIYRTVSNSPTVAYYSPVNATAGTTVTFAGQNFSSVTDVKFAGISAASFSIVSPTVLTAIVGSVPPGTIGDVTVVSPCINIIRSGYSAYEIPAITSFTPASGKIDEIVTINGNNFNSTFSNNTVFFGAVKATILSGNSNSLTVKVPAGASFEPIAVSDNTTALTGWSRQPYVVTNSCVPANINSTSFSPKTDYSVGANPFQITIGDLDNDGKPEVLVANGSVSTISMFKNTSINNTLSFDPKIDFAGVRSNVICDINADGKLDIVSVNSNVFSVFVNTSSGGIISFAPKVDFPTNGADVPTNIAYDDIDGDGKIDILISYNTLDVLSIYKNTSSVGSVSFAPRIDMTAPSFEIILFRDLDGDSKSEIIGLRRSTAIQIYKNTSSIGSLSFGSGMNVSGGNNIDGLDIADFDKDGRQDIAITSTTDNTVSLIRNISTYATLLFANRITFPTAQYPRGIYANDVDGDGRIDLAIVNFGAASMSILKNTSSGSGSISFANKVDFATGVNSNYPVVCDLTGDGKPELLCVTQSSGLFSVFQNTMTGNIALPGVADVKYCYNDEAVPLTATGTSLLWYTTSIGGLGSINAPIPLTNVSGNVSYYVSQTVSGCESARSRIVVTTNTEVLAPGIISPINYCKDAISNPLSATGSSLLWYTNSTGGSGSTIAPTPSTNVSGTVSYYVSQTISGCEGPRAQIDVVTSTVSVPPQPTVITPISYNQNDISVPLTAVGTNLLWYVAPTGGIGSSTAPIPSTSSPGTSTYYVSQTVNGCESSRNFIRVIINSVTAINAGIDNRSVSVYPNPTNSDNITIAIGANLLGTDYSLTDQTGKIVLRGKLLEEKNVINIEKLFSGLYILNIGGATYANLKFIKLK